MTTKTATTTTTSRAKKTKTATTTTPRAKKTKTATAPEPQVARSVVPLRFKQAYAKAGHPARAGDDIASLLEDATHDPTSDRLDPKAFAKVCGQNGIDPARWADKNPGMQRMNAGNVLRGMVRRGITVRIGEAVVEGRKAA